MGIQQLTMDYSGQDGINPRRGAMVTTDNLGTITTAGYLNTASKNTGISFYPTDFIAVSYNGGSAWFSLSFSPTGIITMEEVAGSLTGAVLLAPAGDQTITAHNLIVSQGNIQAGSSGHGGTLASYPGTAAKGSFVVQAVANTGNTTTTLKNDAMGQATAVNVPDPANAVGQLLIGATATPFTSGHLIQANGTVGVTSDSGIVAANVVVQSGLNGFTKLINSIALTHTNLAAAAIVPIITAATGSAQYQLSNIFLNGVTGTNFSGGGGDRNLNLTDGTHEFTLVPAATLQSLTNSGWGSVAVPYPTIVAISQASSAGANIYAQYANGSADYTAGSVTLTLEYTRIA